MTSCLSAVLENSVWTEDGSRLDGEALYVLEDDTVQCGWCLESTNFNLEPSWGQIYCKLPRDAPGICRTCSKNFNKEANT